MARPCSCRDPVLAAADQGGDLGNRLMLPADENRVFRPLYRRDQLRLLTLQESPDGEIDRGPRPAQSSASACRLSDPERRTGSPGFASGGPGKAPPAGLKRPTRALAPLPSEQRQGPRVLEPFGMIPGPPSPFGFSAWRMSMILAAGITVSVSFDRHLRRFDGPASGRPRWRAERSPFAKARQLAARRRTSKPSPLFRVGRKPFLYLRSSAAQLSRRV